MKKIPSYFFATLCCGLTLAATSNAATLVTHYDFEGSSNTIRRQDKATGGSVLDHLSAVAVVAYPQNVSVSPDKPASTVADLRGVDNALTAPNSVDVSMSGSFSIALWIKYEGAQDGFSTVINKRRDSGITQPQLGSSNYWMGQGEISAPNDSFRASFDYDDGANGTNIPGWAQYSYGDYVETDWHHYAMVFDTDANTLKLYLDGLLVVSNTGVTQEPLTDTASGGSPLSIGRRGTGSTDFNGFVDDIRFYKGVLTDQEVYSLAVPEPSTLALAALAMIGLRRRK